MTNSTGHIAGLLSSATERLQQAGVPSPDTDAEILLAHILEISRGELAALIVAAKEYPPPTAGQRDEFHKTVERRAEREPLQHIIGVAWFRSLTLTVGPGVFVPRPETELLAGIAIDALRVMPDPSPIAIDLGTGSGAIALSIAKEVPHAQVFALEKSEEAFAWAQRNFDESKLDNVTLVRGEITGNQLSRITPNLEGTVSVVVSNPPYIPDDAIPRDAEVRLYDPALALFGGQDGLDIVRDIASVALKLARSGGLLAIEHGEEQGSQIREIFADAGWVNPQTHLDLLGRDRFTTATHP